MRAIASLLCGLLATMIAFDCGLPWWRDEPIGDASDFFLVTALAVFAALTAIREARP